MRDFKIVRPQRLQQVWLVAQPAYVDAHQHLRKLLVVQPPRTVRVVSREQCPDLVLLEVAPELVQPLSERLQIARLLVPQVKVRHRFLGRLPFVGFAITFLPHFLEQNVLNLSEPLRGDVIARVN